MIIADAESTTNAQHNILHVQVSPFSPRPLWPADQCHLHSQHILPSRTWLSQYAPTSQMGRKKARMIDGFFFRLFLVPKKEGQMRPVLNLKLLNQFIYHRHFKMEGMHIVRDLLQRGDWMTRIDIKDA